MFMKNKTYDGVDGVELEDIWIVKISSSNVFTSFEFI